MTDLFSATAAGQQPLAADQRVVLVIHGGAGALSKEEMTPEFGKQYHAELENALHAGHAVLKKGGSSLDAIEAAIKIMEDSPLFNAGKGAVFTHDGRNELDASIMSGRDLSAGAVAGVTTIKNPITAARAVMEKSKHVMMVGPGAEQFAKEAGLETVDPKYFWTERRWQDLQRALEEEKQLQQQLQQQQGQAPRSRNQPYYGTVGAVALDQAGNLAAGTSTGGMTNKRFGRVGDSPVIGAGTYADNTSCGVSCTGHGEFFIRHAVAHEISALVKHKQLSVQAAGEQVINQTLVKAGGEGGAIILDTQGNVAMPFNSDGMYRGTITASGKITTAIHELESTAPEK